MKNRYIIGGLAVALMTPALVSCGDDFLSEEPITNISSVTVNTSEEGANAAVTGLVRQMQRQFTDLKNGNLNASGETFFANIYGEALGPDNNVERLQTICVQASSLPTSVTRQVGGHHGCINTAIP